MVGVLPLGWNPPLAVENHPTGSDRASFLEQVSRDLALRDSSDAAVSRARIHEKHQKKRRKERSKRGGGKGWVIFSWVVAVVWIFRVVGTFFLGGLDCLHIPKIFRQVANPKKSEMPSLGVGVEYVTWEAGFAGKVQR